MTVRLTAASLCLLLLACVPAQAQPREVSWFDASNRFLDKDFPAVKLVPSTTVIDSFEDWAATKKCWGVDERFMSVEPVAEHATDGKLALKVTFRKPGHPNCNLRYVEGTPGWGGGEDERKAALSHRIIFNDEVRLDVLNPGAAVTLVIEMGKPFTIDLAPGNNEIVLKTADMIKDVFRITGILNNTRISPAKGDAEVVLYLDHFRWVGPGVGENLLKNARLFDFGSASYCRPHFSQVDSTTGYTKDRGYGWEKPAEKVFEYSNNMVTNSSSGRQPHDELLRDYVYQINSPFLVDLPDGRYRVHLLEGANMGWYSLHGSRYDLEIVANGKPVLVRRAASSPADQIRAFFALDQADWEPGEDRFGKYFAADCRPVEFDADVAGGQLKLEFNTDPLRQAQVSFLIVYPVAEAARAEPEIAALWRDIRHRFNDVSWGPFPRKMAEEMHVPGLHEEYFFSRDVTLKKQIQLPAVDIARRGYVLYNREPVDEVYPDTVPSPEECAAAFAASAPRGEIVSFAPALYALKDLEEVALDVGDFVGANGRKIGKDRADVRVVNCMYRMVAQQSHGDWRYMVMPWYLARRDRVKVVSGTSRRWWINVDVPADAAPGTYVATATVRARNALPSELKLRLDVLPFTLDPLPAGVEYGMYTGVEGWWYQQPFTYGWRYHISWRPRASRESKAAMDANLAECEKLQRAALKAQFDLLKRYGFTTLFQYRPDKDMTPELYEGLAVIGGEAEIGKVDPKPPWPVPPTFAHKVPDRKRAYLYNPSAWKQDLVDELRKEGLAVSLNWILAWEDVNQEAGLNRFESGFLMWRLGATGCVHNPWRQSWGNPYHPFDGHSGEWGSYCMPGSGAWPTLNSTVVLEGAREGITDYRWLVTLERLAKEKAGTPAAEAAKQFLADLRGKIVGDAAHYFQPVGSRHGGWGQTWSQKDTAWRGADYRDVRARMASLIAALNAAR